MRIPRTPHRWRLTPAQAVAVQRRLAERVREIPLRRPPRLVAGLDCAFSQDDVRCLAAAVVWDAEADAVREVRHAARPLRFPYVPGLLSFREAPALLAALRALRCTPDLLMVDGHGRAHPRRFGIACHIGVLSGLPTLGLGKSRLVGEPAEPGPARGARAALWDRGERIGTVLRTRDGVRPVIVSVGHAIPLATAERIALDAARHARLPEPVRLADHAVGRWKRERAQRDLPTPRAARS